MSIKLLCFAGSLRAESWNAKVIGIAGRAAERGGASVTYLDLRDYRLPVFDEDLESSDGLPDACVALKDLFKAHQGMLIGCPEYNSGITGVLKNTIDWVSRPREGEQLEPFDGKVVGLTGASPGQWGGIRGLPMARFIFQNIKANVVANTANVPKVHEQWDEDAQGLRDEKLHAMVEGVGERVAEMAAKLNA